MENLVFIDLFAGAGGVTKKYMRSVAIKSTNARTLK